MTPWSAPRAHTPLAARVTLPGSKSLTNRFLLLGALAQGPTTLSGALRARDCDLMIEALRRLGASIEADGTEVSISPGPLRPAAIDCGLAGTVMRFVPAVAALAAGRSDFDGDPAARLRPLGPLLGALRDLGATVLDDDGHLPISVTGTGSLAGGEVRIDTSASSQFLSALLLIGPHTERGLDIHAISQVPSLPHVQMTVATLREFGASVEDGTDSWRVAPGGLTGRPVQVEPDLTNAGPFLAAALAAGGEVAIAGWPAKTTQAGALLPGLLEAMGAHIERHGGDLLARGDGPVHGLSADLSRAGELVPTLAALAVLADSPSELRGIAHLRGHETDRLAALEAEIRKLGADARQLPDGLVIVPPPTGRAGLHGACLRSYADHRLATFAAIVGLAIDSVSVDDIAATSKTLPDFPQLWAAMLAGGEA